MLVSMGSQQSGATLQMMMIHNSINFNLPGYRAIAEIYRDAKTVVYRAVQIGLASGTDLRPVAIKILASAYPTERELLEFRHQYAIAKQLAGTGIANVYSLEEYERGYALVMEDFGGISLSQYCQDRYLSPIETIEIAIQLADILQAIDRQQIVHQDIKPANILIHPQTKQVKLIDFSIASVLPCETPAPIDPHRLAGTLAYLAPEQTGRMNRGIDYRTDFYGLGITLYELLTGKLPFGGDLSHRSPRAAANDLIYGHLAQIAIPVDRVNVAVPPVVAQIVAKLMAKTAEDRYQSALGLKSDLENCLRQWQQTRSIVGFELGRQDLCDRFSIPERLYGRAIAVQTLLDTYERVARGSSELMLVAGGSGIGKTAVINEVHKPIVRQQGWFIQGKFDQFNLNLPLSAFVQAVRDLIGQLFSDNDLQLASWQSQILAAVGDSGQVLIEVIPELEQLIGAQPPVTELVGTAAQNRFNWLFQKLIEIFTQPEHPLTIFLDDLQWADSASLQLIKQLMAGKGYLLVLGAYRDREVSLLHPLMLTVDELRQAEKTVQTMTIAPLAEPEIGQLIADTLHCSIERAQPLTELIASKTQGNPFFITQFLKALAEDGELRFAPEGYWECDIARIQALAITDDVVAFMTAQLQKLPLATQAVLKLAACIGDRFDLQTLAIVSQQSPLATAADLWQGLQAGLIRPDATQLYQFWQPAAVPPALALPIASESEPGAVVFGAAGGGFRFRHDRVQQAAAALIPEAQQQQTHLQIGRLLLANTPDRQQSEQLFEIVNHFNRALAAIDEPAERELVAKLNLDAARKARSANAYAAAFHHARIGTEILGVAGWETAYQLALGLHETLAEAAFFAETTRLDGNFGSVPELVQIVLDRARTAVDRAKSYETLIHFHDLQQQYHRSIADGLEILHQLGLNLSPQPDRVTMIRELILTKIALNFKSNDYILSLPVVTDPTQIARLRILNLLQIPAFFCSQELMAVLSFVGIRLTLRYGNTPWSASFYNTYCIAIAGLGELKQTYRIGQLAMKLADRFADKWVIARTKVVAAWYAKPWQEPLPSMIPLLDESLRLAIDSGDLHYIGINAVVSLAARFYAGICLDELVDRSQKSVALTLQSQDRNSQQLIEPLRQTIVKLQLPSARSTASIEISQAEILLISQWQASNEALLLSNLYSAKTLLAYLFEDLPQALSYADAQLPYEFSVKGAYSITHIWTIDALTRLAAYPHSHRRVQKHSLDRVKFIQRQLLKRARLMPANFQHKYELVSAEKCRVLGNFTLAMDLYDLAIAGAKTHKYLQDEALANELSKWAELNVRYISCKKVPDASTSKNYSDSRRRPHTKRVTSGSNSAAANP